MNTCPTFDPVAHVYSDENGVSVPSVTTIISKMGLAPPYPEDRGQKELGSAIHRAGELAMWDRLDVDGTHPGLLPYVEGVLEKQREMKIVPIQTELRVWHGPMNYAGTLDLFCRIFDGELAIFDYKSGAPPQCVELQLAGYEEALRWMISAGQSRLSVGGRIRRFSMQLTPGRAIVRECKDEWDRRAWIAAVDLYRWKYERRKA